MLRTTTVGSLVRWRQMASMRELQLRSRLRTLLTTMAPDLARTWQLHSMRQLQWRSHLVPLLCLIVGNPVMQPQIEARRMAIRGKTML